MGVGVAVAVSRWVESGEWGMGYKNWKPPKCECGGICLCVWTQVLAFLCVWYSKRAVYRPFCVLTAGTVLGTAEFCTYSTVYYFPHKIFQYSMIPGSKYWVLWDSWMCSFPRLTPWFKTTLWCHHHHSLYQQGIHYSSMWMCVWLFVFLFFPFLSDLELSNTTPIPRPTTPPAREPDWWRKGW